MTQWPPNPKIYQINTWVWLNTLSEKYGKKITLANVPKAVIDELASYHVDAIWLMGVWHRGKLTRESALNYVHEYEGALPDITEDDVSGSAYAIGNYEIEDALGGRKGFESFRKRLLKKGLRMVLDYVPNHTGKDHRWLRENPDFYLRSTPELFVNDPTNFFHFEGERGEYYFFSHGRDPYFPGWIDTAQLNAFSQGYRNAAIEILCNIASMADGVRCDMAMLMTTEVFMRSWGWLGGLKPLEKEFWEEVIPAVKAKYPDFIFIAEVYWDMNYQILQQGFDYTYDKTMYDRLTSGDIGGIRSHLWAEMGFLSRQIRFIENHDEPRAADALGIERSRPGAVIISTLPGATLLHDGQFTGRLIKLPVQINRQPHEREYPALKDFYMRLLAEVSDDIYQHGTWMTCESLSCDGCQHEFNILAYVWQTKTDCRLIVLNLSDHWAQSRIDLSNVMMPLKGKKWRMLDVLDLTFIDEAGNTLAEAGLTVDLDAHHARIYHFTPLPEKKTARQATGSKS